MRFEVLLTAGARGDLEEIVEYIAAYDSLIYRVTARKVYVHIIADGRRDMQSLLARRLLGSQ